MTNVCAKNMNEHYVWEKNYIWNPTTCSYKNV